MKKIEEISADDPWSELESAWQEPPPPTISDPNPSRSPDTGPVPEERAAETQSRRIARLARRELWIRWTLRISEALIFLIFGALSVRWLMVGPLEMRTAGVFVLTLLSGVAWIRRRTFFDLRAVPNAEAPARFVETLLERNREGYRGLRFGKILLAIEVLFFTVWLYWARDPARPWQTLDHFGFLALWTVLFLVALRLSRRYLDRQRRHLEELRDQLHGDDIDSNIREGIRDGIREGTAP